MLFLFNKLYKVSMVLQNTNTMSQQQFPVQMFSKKRAYILIVLLVCAIFLSSWSLIHTVLLWYASTVTTSSSHAFWLSAIYASMAVGVILGVLSMVVALAVAVPAIVVIWSAVLVLLSFFGKPRVSVVAEGMKLTAEMGQTVGMVVIKEGNLVAAVCAVLGYFLFVIYGKEHCL
ncbi:hypothetical protein HanRHA438_Chr17g0820161 [Helianthus annuus]|nr:hypothetical protein HanHA300_Chr17g0659641 [Helianthus annuus]KAJ0448055.1 hypothetical protein HanHA89_Chr17g0712421 [Helianthus annuus]KAJ0632943.1 hypothetical protein HanLR1_Chr17g0670941 [Helianthus annuus]KAJ0636762.1 hypothetical protein HanOQP8_Chr17g0665761 [Helianthus annuus]KAJ0807618.1 hypothetical protein HanLR1_Chr00c1154g0791901 [Helianthus annuus]